MSTILDGATYLFDPLHAFWERPKTKRGFAIIQVAAFLLGLGGIELNRRGLLPEPLAQLTPMSHFYAIKLAFSLVLIQEVIDLVFTLPCSVSKAVGKQFEILALILLRNSFKELIHFKEPIEIASGLTPILPIITDAAGALCIFVGLGLYYRLVSRKAGTKATALYRFVAAKKLISLVLLAVFFGVAIMVGVDSAETGHAEPFFGIFYTILIFSDILLVLISHLHLPSFHSIFRNSGFAVSTLLIRMALAAPAYYDAAIGVSAMAFAICLALAYNYFGPESGKG